MRGGQERERAVIVSKSLLSQRPGQARFCRSNSELWFEFII